MKKIYFLSISLLITITIKAQDKIVMVVSQTNPAEHTSNQHFIDSLNIIEGISAEWVDFTTLGTVNYNNYDAVVITEDGASSTMRDYGNRGYPLPTVHLKTYALYQSSTALIPNSADAFYSSQQFPFNAMPEGKNKMIVKDSSDILCNYNVGDTLTWTLGYNDGTANSGHIQGLDFKKSPVQDIADNASVLGTSPWLESLTDAGVITSYMWKIEENSVTKRFVVWGVHEDMLQKATADFWHIIQNAVLWVLDENLICPEEPEAIKNNAMTEFSIFPNPVTDVLTINNAGSVNNVDIIDITGKAVNTIFNFNNAQLKINTTGLAKGIYLLRIRSNDGNTYLQKIIK